MTSDREDNDLFFVIGTVDTDITPEWDPDGVTDSIRSEVSRMGPMLLNVDRASLSLVQYDDRRLPLSTSTRIPVDGRDSR
jgi:hypothetical protein